ncbi:MAG: hypothetical protein RL398_1297 [Planctomycetota bacterium]
MNAAATLLLAMGAAVGAVAQAPQEGDPQPAALHRAWLSEVLDLDTGAAARQYAKIARDQRSSPMDRWAAAARLAELQRLGVETPPAPGLGEAPTTLRSLLGPAAPSLDAASLALRLSIDRTVTLHELAELGARLPDVRTFVPAVEEWQLAQTGPSMRDRQRQRMQAFANLSRSPQVNVFLQRLYATTIVSAEIDGRRSQADALRALYFASWKPPEVTGTDAEVVARALQSLDTWLEERTLSRQQRTVLTSLRAFLSLHAAEPEAAAARALLLRLPRTCERLLGS